MAVFPLDGADEEALHRSADVDLYADKVDMPAQPAGDRAGAATVSRGYGTRREVDGSVRGAGHPPRG
jgi:hypothetical protein